MSVTAWVGVALAGGLGAVLRMLAGNALLVNLTGAFALGLLVGADAGGDARRIAAIGFLGAFTTFSAWMLEAYEAGRPRALLVLAPPLVTGLAAIWLGRALF